MPDTDWMVHDTFMAFGQSFQIHTLESMGSGRLMSALAGNEPALAVVFSSSPHILLK